MTSRTHDIFALASLITVAANFPPAVLNIPTLVTASIASVIGSLLPDIDQESNRLWDLLPAGEIISHVSDGIFIAHRTISHSILGCAIAYKFFEWVLPKILNTGSIDIGLVLASLMVGYISHLLLDSFTEEGIPLFFPIRFRFGFPPIPSWRIKTGKWFEKFVVFPGIILYLLWFSIENQSRLIYLFRVMINK